MDLTTILQAIATVGFPICACIVIGWYFSKVNDNYRNDIKEITASHKEEISQLAKVIQDNSLVIQKLCDSLDDLKKG
jgi:hypothetical protein